MKWPFFVITAVWGIGTALCAAPLHEVIQQLYGETVLPYDRSQSEWLEVALEDALERINAEGVTAPRVNEVGNAVEDVVCEALRRAGFEADRPMTRSGHRRAAGYPDIEASRGEDAFYFEIKTYHPSTEDSSQRTFYLSPSDDPKVTHPAFHLVIAFAMEEREPDRYFARRVRVVDLHDLPVKLKLEYNANNRNLYGNEAAQVLELPGEATDDE